MTTTPAQSYVAISIDAETPAIAQQFRSVAQQSSMPVTWGVSNCDQVSHIVPRGAGHEAALLVDRAVDGAAATREVAQRVAAARTEGVVVTSILLREAVTLSHYDLLFDQGVSVIAACGPDEDSRVKPLRAGLWRLPAHIRLAEDIKWGSAGAAKKIIRRSIATGESIHIHVQAGKLNAKGWATTASVLQFAAQCVQQGALHAGTLNQMARQMSQLGSPTRSQSVLRAA